MLSSFVDYTEFSAVSQKKLDGLQINANRLINLPNMQSLFAELTIGECVVISDSNFGYAQEFHNMRAFHLSARSKLYCLWKRDNPNPLIEPFIDTLRTTFQHRKD